MTHFQLAIVIPVSGFLNVFCINIKNGGNASGRKEGRKTVIRGLPKLDVLAMDRGVDVPKQFLGKLGETDAATLCRNDQ